MTVARTLDGQVLGVFDSRVQIIEIDGLVDLYYEEIHELRIASTSQPIEGGSSITDNAIVEPQRLRMSGFVSNLIPTGSGGDGLPVRERGKEAWAQLEALARTREPVAVQTTLKLYEGFLIEALSTTINEQSGTSLDFVIELKEILFADSEFTTLPADTVTGPAGNKSGTVDGGNKQSVDVPEKRKASLLSRIVDGF